MHFVSSGGDATLIGFNEYANPSTPPKKYRRQIVASGAPFVTCYALPANCGAPGCPPSISFGWTGQIPGSGDTFTASGSFTLLGVTNGVATYLASGLFARRLNPGGKDEIIGARIAGDPAGGAGFTRFEGQTIALPVGLQVNVSLQVNWVQWTTVGQGGCVIAGGASFTKTGDTWNAVSQYDAATGAFSQTNVSTRVTGSGASCGGAPSGATSAISNPSPSTFYGSGAMVAAIATQRTTTGIGCVDIGGGSYNNYSGTITETLQDEDTELAAEDRVRTAGAASIAFRTERGNGFTWSFQTFGFTTYFDINCPGRYDFTVYYSTKPHGATGPITPRASVISMLCERGVQKIEGGFTADTKDTDYIWDRIEARKHCDAAPPGAPNFAIGSVKARLSLGQVATGDAAGDLLVEASTITSAIYTPALLGAATPDVGGVEIVRDDSNFVRQVKATQALADVVTLSTSSYEVRFYPLSQVGTQDPATKIYTVSGAPFVVYKFENPDTAQATRLRITETRGGTSKVTEYSYDPANALWALSTGDGSRKETQMTTTVRGNRVTTITISDAANVVVSKTTRTYHTYAWAEELISEVLDPDGAALTTAYEFYDTVATSDPNYGRLKQQTNADGSWSRYTYDANHRILKAIRPFLDAAPTTTNEALCRVTENVYDTIADADGDGAVEQRITTIESMLGQETGRRYRIEWSKTVALGGDVCTRRSDIVCVAVGAAWNAAGNLVTETLRYGTGFFANRDRRIVNPDGTVTLTTYVLSSSGQTTMTTKTGQPNPAMDDIVDGRRMITITTAANQVMSETSADIASNLALLGWAATEFDTVGRPTRLDYTDGTYVTRSFACCGLASERDRSGLVTSYGYDVLGHLATTTRLGVTAKTVFDADGRVKTVSRIGEDNSEIVQERNGYDLAGRLTSRQDALTRTTAFAESFDSTSGHLTRTTTHPDGGTVIEVFARDGVKLTTGGTAAAPHSFEYGVDPIGVFAKDTAIGIDSNNQPTSTEWTKSYVDFAGRSLQTVFADNAATQSFYNILGQLVRQVDADGVTTLFAYNARGELETTAVDLNANNAIDLAGVDRVTKTVSSVATKTDGGTTYTVLRTTTHDWETDNQDTSVIIATSEQSSDGLRFWQMIRGSTTKSVTMFDGSGGRTVTTTAPDGTKTIQAYNGDELASTTVKSVADAQLAATTYTYDSQGRLLTATDARNGTTTFSYYADDQIHTVTTPDPDTTRSGVGYDPQTTTYAYDSAGRVQTVTQPDGGIVTTTYWPTGAVKRTSGARTYPIEYSYDPQGRVKTLTTWQNYAGDSGKAVTMWNYDAARGRLQNKRYADNTGPSYTYKPSGRLWTRTWARSPSIVTTYSYNAAGDLAGVDYSDATPDVSLDYDRTGRLATMTDGVGSRALAYHTSGQLGDETYTAGILNGTVLARSFDSLQRLSGITGGPAPAIGYGYDDASRLDTVTVGANTAKYGYPTNSTLVERVTFKNGGATRLTTTKVYDKLKRLTSITNTPFAGTASSYTYSYNNANQRTRATREDNAYWSYAYDALGQVTKGGKFLADDSAALGLAFDYTYDDIGNRRTATANGQTVTYTPTLLNQYTQRTVPGAIDVTGAAATGTTVTVNVNNGTPQATTRQGEAFHTQLTIDNSSAAQNSTLSISGVKNRVGPNGEDAVTEITKSVHLAKTPEAFVYDADGNLTDDARWHYTWDGENRLIAIETSSLAVAAGLTPQKLEFLYDGQSRRIEKKVSSWNGTAWIVASQTRFLYDGWNPIAELNALNSNAVVRTYAWGLDAGGTGQRAGGVGGLLSVTDSETNAVHFVGFDGNGNVSTLAAAADGSISARYDYNAFGEMVLTDGRAATMNPFGFSTKFRDIETGHLYYGYRCYAPETERWLSRDPIGEEGGINVYGFVANSAPNLIDPIGENAFDTYLKIADAIDDAAKACSCHSDVVNRLNALRDSFARNNKALERVVEDLQRNFSAARNNYDGGVRQLERLAFADRILSRLTGGKPVVSEAINLLKDEAAVELTSKYLGKASDALAIADSLSRRDAVDLTMAAFSLLPEKTIAFGPKYYLQAYRGVSDGLSRIAPDIFVRQANFLAVTCSDSDREQIELALKKLESRVFQDLIKL